MLRKTISIDEHLVISDIEEIHEDFKYTDAELFK